VYKGGEDSRSSPRYFLSYMSRSRIAIGLAVMAGVAGVAALYAATRPASPAVRHLRAGNALAAAGNSADAIREWQVAEALDPSVVEAHEALGRVYLDAGALAVAIRELTAVSKAAPNRPHAFCRLARACREGALTELAFQAAKEAVGREPRCARAHQVLGELQLDRQNLGESLREEEAAVKLEPENYELRIELARLYLGLSELSKAEEQVRHALKLEPQGLVAPALLAHLMLEQGDTSRYPEAEQALRRCVAAEPDNAEALADLGRLLLSRGEPKEAAKYLDRVLGVQPRHREAVQNLARAFSALHRDDEARALRRFGEQLAADDQRRKELDRVLTQHPNDGAALYELATLTEREGDYVRCIGLLEAAALSRPDDRVILERLSRVRGLLARASAPSVTRDPK